MWRDVSAAIVQLDAMRAAGLGVVRFDVSWANMEPRLGRFEGLDRLDAVLAAIEERSMLPVITVIETPGWANGGRGPWTPPDHPAAYATFVAMLADRYASARGIAWEIWNEPNDPRFWRPHPDPVRYTRLLEAAAAAIRGVAPADTILGGSLLFADRRYLQGMLDAGARQAFDGLAIHPYAGHLAPGQLGDGYHSFSGTINRLEEVLAHNGFADVPVWITEVGWAEDGAVDAHLRAHYLAEAVAIVAARPEIRVMAVYTMDRADDATYGLTSEGRAGPDFAAYARAVAEAESAP